jgi:hypothetical protein
MKKEEKKERKKGIPWTIGPTALPNLKKNNNRYLQLDKILPNRQQKWQVAIVNPDSILFVFLFGFFFFFVISVLK